MSYDWNTSIFFERHEECRRDFLTKIAIACTTAGFALVGENQEQSTESDREATDGFPTDWEAMLDKAVSERRFSSNIHHKTLNLRGWVTATPCGRDREFPEFSAYKEYGAVWFGLGSLNLVKWQDEEDIISYENMMAIFRASQLLTRTAETLYGFGDLLVKQVGDPFMYAEDLKERRLPHFAWWNYFSNEYLNTFGKDRLLNVSWWMNVVDPNGQVFITRPPIGRLSSTNEEYKQIMG
jgi:hypothetical protein